MIEGVRSWVWGGGVNDKVGCVDMSTIPSPLPILKGESFSPSSQTPSCHIEQSQQVIG